MTEYLCQVCGRPAQVNDYNGVSQCEEHWSSPKDNIVRSEYCKEGKCFTCNWSKCKCDCHYRDKSDWWRFEDYIDD